MLAKEEPNEHKRNENEGDKRRRDVCVCVWCKIWGYLGYLSKSQATPP
jgi:hypothetical protein